MVSLKETWLQGSYYGFQNMLGCLGSSCRWQDKLPPEWLGDSERNQEIKKKMFKFTFHQV